jgi:hypothetical protein
MKSSYVPVRSRWKSVALCLLLVGTFPLTHFTFAETADADAPRQQAVSEYIDGATKELDVYRQQIGAAARADNAQLLSEAKSKLDVCDRLVANLKLADAETFDLIKANYERTRGEMIKALQAAQKK